MRLHLCMVLLNALSQLAPFSTTFSVGHVGHLGHAQYTELQWGPLHGCFCSMHKLLATYVQLEEKSATALACRQFTLSHMCPMSSMSVACTVIGVPPVQAPCHGCRQSLQIKLEGLLQSS